MGRPRAENDSVENRPPTSEPLETPGSSSEPRELKAIGRLAPSPTGALHLGNARSFLCAWLSIRQQGGEMILRIEDLDSPRVKPWARDATLADLRWLGLDWDYGPDVGGPHAPYVQTNRLQLYRAHLDQMIARELVYPCNCSRTEVAASASAPHEAIEGPIYAGNCSQRSTHDAGRFTPTEFAWRFRASSLPRSWVDAVSGAHAARVAEQLGDFVVAKGDGTPAYQLAVVVDDHLMGVTEVVRGNDLIPSTFRQLDLLSALNWRAPSYMHLPLMVGADGRRLAKRHGDTRLAWFRQAGFEADQIVGYLAWTAGLLPAPARTMPGELIAAWSPLRVSSQSTVVRLPELLEILSVMG